MKTLITNSKPYKNYGYEMEQFERENNVLSHEHTTNQQSKVIVL
ncbi:hypothetical protein Remus_002 [Silviavirus remus]|uniref:Uncharacterized protein n=1 Tax=Silviavirus remus TaxID=1857890 RepID=A0A8E5KCM4_9CAUD|nr:hypothetical protein Remus_002 [Silviavirus remus]